MPDTDDTMTTGGTTHTEYRAFVEHENIEQWYDGDGNLNLQFPDGDRAQISRQVIAELPLHRLGEAVQRLIDEHYQDMVVDNTPTPVDWARVTVYHDGERDTYRYDFPDGVSITLTANQLEGIPQADRTRYIETLYFRERGQGIMNEEDSKKDRTQMTLNEVVYCLERFFHTEKYPEGVTISNDLGGHRHCFINTNCPEAVKIRKYLDEAGITLEEIDTIWREVNNTPRPDKLTFKLPDLSGMVKIRVAGKDIEVDVKEELDKVLSQNLRTSLEHLRYAESDIQAVGDELFRNYLHMIRDAKKDRTLPQVAFRVADLLKYKCVISSEGSKDTYYFVFPIIYNPQWLYSRGNRYKLHSTHIEALRQEVYLTIPVTLGKKCLPPYLRNVFGNKFVHYHGTDHDCWGDVHPPPKWDGSLEQIAALAKQMETALTTINDDSLMTPAPPNMPTVPALKKKVKEVGKEGEREIGAEEVTNGREEDTPPPPRGWGEDRTEDNNAGQEVQQAEPAEVNPEERR